MRILIAADSFKNALDAASVCAAIAAGVKHNDPAHEVRELPLADGGEGTAEVLVRALGLSEKTIDTVDPLGRPLRLQIGFDAARRISAIDLAQTSGLQLLAAHERNPLRTTTFGTGRAIAEAIALGAERILLGIGGSATNDGGIGIAKAFGWRFLDDRGDDLDPTGEHLLEINRIVPPARVPSATIDILCDVDNPLYGAHGAARVFARQKGASEEQLALLDAGLKHLADLVQRQGISTLSPETPGAGAAGGGGFGACVFLNAALHRGIDYILDLTQFDAALAQSDLVITGEGNLDRQTLHGKLIHGVCRRAARRNIPVIAMCGQVNATAEELNAIGLRAAFSINDGLQSENALAQTAERLVKCTQKLPLRKWL